MHDLWTLKRPRHTAHLLFGHITFSYSHDSNSPPWDNNSPQSRDLNKGQVANPRKSTSHSDSTFVTSEKRTASLQEAKDPPPTCPLVERTGYCSHAPSVYHPPPGHVSGRRRYLQLWIQCSCGHQCRVRLSPLQHRRH